MLKEVLKGGGKQVFNSTFTLSFFIKKFMTEGKT